MKANFDNEEFYVLKIGNAYFSKFNGGAKTSISISLNSELAKTDTDLDDLEELRKSFGGKVIKIRKNMTFEEVEN